MGKGYDRQTDKEKLAVAAAGALLRLAHAQMLQTRYK